VRGGGLLAAHASAPIRKADGPEFDDKFQAVGFFGWAIAFESPRAEIHGDSR
jgi:hypothetical protein